MPLVPVRVCRSDRKPSPHAARRGRNVRTAEHSPEPTWTASPEPTTADAASSKRWQTRHTPGPAQNARQTAHPKRRPRSGPQHHRTNVRASARQTRTRRINPRTLDRTLRPPSDTTAELNKIRRYDRQMPRSSSVIPRKRGWSPGAGGARLGLFVVSAQAGLVPRFSGGSSRTTGRPRAGGADPASSLAGRPAWVSSPRRQGWFGAARPTATRPCHPRAGGAGPQATTSPACVVTSSPHSGTSPNSRT